jgi:hypothetical protein
MQKRKKGLQFLEAAFAAGSLLRKYSELKDVIRRFRC